MKRVVASVILLIAYLFLFWLLPIMDAQKDGAEWYIYVVALHLLFVFALCVLWAITEILD